MSVEPWHAATPPVRAEGVVQILRSREPSGICLSCLQRTLRAECREQPATPHVGIGWGGMFLLMTVSLGWTGLGSADENHEIGIEFDPTPWTSDTRFG